MLPPYAGGHGNLRGDDEASMRRHAWVGPDSDQPWLRGGSYPVARRIRMHIESWDRSTLGEQQQVFGRTKQVGAPLTGTHELDRPNFRARDSSGQPVIPVDAHIRVAAPENNGGKAILRRGYSFTDGIDPASGELDAGLFFIVFVNDPTVFVDLQNKLGSLDALSEYIVHDGSGLFACPPGVRDAHDHWGRALFA